jgi:Dynamin family
MNLNEERRSQFELEVLQHAAWKQDILRSIHIFEDYFEQQAKPDYQRSLRFQQLKDLLISGRLSIAFVGEFSRGKSELINAIFFSGFGYRVLPSGIGRTTMCPTEIYHDEKLPPSLQLLSIETRLRGESISQLKSSPVQWSRMELNLSDQDAVRESLKSLTSTRKVTRVEAMMYGFGKFDDLAEELDSEEYFEIPAWRYARINMPHPLLSAGLTILDTPGLNALGSEPELTLSILPNVQAVVFLLGADTGVTKSDMEIWKHVAAHSIPAKIAVLNKADVLLAAAIAGGGAVEDLKRFKAETAETLGIPVESTFFVSAQRAFLGRTNADERMIAVSAIEKFEKYLAESIVPAQRQLISKSVLTQLGDLLRGSTEGNQMALHDIENTIAKLGRLSSEIKTKQTSEWQAIQQEKSKLNDVLTLYRDRKRIVFMRRDALMAALNPSRFDVICGTAMEAIDGSWTTPGLTNGMRRLVASIKEYFDDVAALAAKLLLATDETFDLFAEYFVCEKSPQSPPDFDRALRALQDLGVAADAFCRDPVNVVLTEKRFMTQRFWNAIVERARTIYSESGRSTEVWIAHALIPIEMRMKELKQQTEARVQILTKIQEKSGTVSGELVRAMRTRSVLLEQKRALTTLIDNAQIKLPAANVRVAIDEPSIEVASA